MTDVGNTDGIVIKFDAPKKPKEKSVIPKFPNEMISINFNLPWFVVCVLSELPNPSSVPVILIS